MNRVVIVGGGFGGLYAAKVLGSKAVDVTLIDRRNFHLFQPLLYQVATGGLSPGDIAAPLRGVLRRHKNIEVVMGEVTDIDPAAKVVKLADREVAYDSLIVATGATHSYFGNGQWERVAPGLKTIEDATEIRRRFLMAFEKAELELDRDTMRAWLTFVVVGGGPTGVELAGAIGEIAHSTLREDFRHVRPEEARVLLLDAGPRILAAYPPELSEKAEQSLIKLDVRARTGVKVTAIDEFGVTVQTAKGEERIEARTVFWAAGVQASPVGRLLAERTGVALDRAGRVMVQPDLTIPGHPEIFVIGDLAHFEQDGAPVPGVAPVAMQQGPYAAETILARERGAAAKPFRYWDKGSMATIGRAAAVAVIGGVRLSGHVAWLAWLFIHLLYLVGFESRLLVAIRWGFMYATFNRGARLITGVQK